MGEVSNLLLPWGARTVPVERVAVLIADAIVGCPPALLTVVLRGKHLPRIGSSSGTPEIAPLLEQDWVRLSQIWPRLPDFATLRLEEWSDYLQMFATSIHRPPWSLAWDVAGNGSSDFGRAKADAYVKYIQLHRRQLTRAMSQAQCAVREAMSEKAAPWFSARDAVLDIDALKNYVACLRIRIHWTQLPTEDAQVQADYNFGSSLDWPRFGYWPKLDAHEAVCLMHGLNPDIHPCGRYMTEPFRDQPDAVAFLTTVVDYFLLADADVTNTKMPADWLRWAESNGIQVHSQFRAWVDRRRVLPGASGSSPAPAPLYVHPQPARRYRTMLDDVLKLARSLALDPSSHQSAWNALLDLARRKEPPAPLVGIGERDGEVVVLYETSDSRKPLTRNAHRGRFNRRIGRGLA